MDEIWQKMAASYKAALISMVSIILMHQPSDDVCVCVCECLQCPQNDVTGENFWCKNFY